MLSVDPQAQRMSLSMKAVLPDQAAEVTDDPEEVDRAQQEAKDKLLSKRTKPLKGGMGRESGGDQFGLKW